MDEELEQIEEAGNGSNTEVNTAGAVSAEETVATESISFEESAVAENANSETASAEENVQEESPAAAEAIFVQNASEEAAPAENLPSENGAENTVPGNSRFFRMAGIILSLAAIVILIVSLIVVIRSDHISEHYTGSNWYAEYQHQEQNLSDGKAFPETLATKESAIAERFSYGNSDELYSVGAAACEDGSYYYFGDPTDHGYLCRISRSDPGKKVRLCELSAEYLNVSSGRIYFINHFTAGGDSAGIYSIARDGSGLKKLLDGNFYSLRMVNEWLYYIGGEDGSIRRMNIHGLSEEILSNEDCNDLWVAGNEIYYISQDKDRPVSERMVICSMNVDGKERREIVNRGYYNAISFHDGILYYSVYNSGYGWIDTTWKEEEASEGDNVVLPQIQVPHDGFVELRGLYSPVTVRDGEVWYIDRSDLRSLSVYTPESGRIRHYDSENVSSFYLMSDLIIVRWLKDGVTPLVSVNRLNTREMVDLFGSAGGIADER